MKGIAVYELTKEFDGHTAVDHITFGIEPGRVTGFLGPNGAGKTTALRMILGHVSPSSGKAYVLGQPYVDLAEPLSTVGAVLDTNQFHPNRSGRNHLRVYANAVGIGPQRVDEVLELVNLREAAGKKVGHYSLGMRQRLGIATALLGDPQILILDEPANGLDPAGIKWLRGFIRDFAANGRTVFVSSHLLAEITKIADDVLVINKGCLVTQAPVQELLSHAADVRVETPQPERLRDALAASGVKATLLAHDELSASASKEVIGTIAAEAHIPVFGLNQEEHSLEQIFLELTGTE